MRAPLIYARYRPPVPVRKECPGNPFPSKGVGSVTSMADVYGQDVQTHWSRFDVSARIEEYVLSRVIREQFPDPTAVVADIGGGNGRHAFRLAGEGYAVWLCDVVEEMAADAQQRNASAAAELGRPVWVCSTGLRHG